MIALLEGSGCTTLYTPVYGPHRLWNLHCWIHGASCQGQNVLLQALSTWKDSLRYWQRTIFPLDWMKIHIAQMKTYSKTLCIGQNAPLTIHSWHPMMGALRPIRDWPAIVRKVRWSPGLLLSTAESKQNPNQKEKRHCLLDKHIPVVSRHTCRLDFLFVSCLSWRTDEGGTKALFPSFWSLYGRNTTPQSYVSVPRRSNHVWPSSSTYIVLLCGGTSSLYDRTNGYFATEKWHILRSGSPILDNS